MVTRLRRRAVLRMGSSVCLAGAAGTAVQIAAGARPGLAAQAAFQLQELRVNGTHASRAQLLLPQNTEPTGRVRLLVALHGLGESHDEARGIRAWLDDYGLRSSYPRLLAPPIQATSKRGDWSSERLSEVNRSLADRPFAGLAVLCPFTPNFRGEADRAGAIRDYGNWLVRELLPQAREAAGLPKQSPVGIDGCSMGGPYAIDIFAAHPDQFDSLGIVQGAFGAHRAPGFAAAIAAARADTHVHLLTSSADSFRDGHVALAKELGQKKVRHTLRIPNGPHDQPFLRETGTIEMLLFHERYWRAP